MFEKLPKYLGNDVDLLGNGSNMWGNDLIISQNILKMWKMTQRFGKWPKYLGNGLDAWGTA